MPPASADPGASGRPAKRRSWIAGSLVALPQILLAVLLLSQGRGRTGSDAAAQAQLGLLAAAVVLFWSLAGCGVLALRRQARPVAAAMVWGASAGFVLAAVAALAA